MQKKLRPSLFREVGVSRSLSRTQAVVLAGVVLVGLVLGVLGLFAAGSRHWVRDAFHVRAGFPDVAGVEVGTRVRVQGIDAGEVEAVELPANPGHPVLLRLRIAGKFRPLIGTDARVEIANESVLAGKIVRVVPGRPGTPPAEEDAVLAGQAPSDLTENLAQATARLNHVLNKVDAVVGDVQSGKGTLGRLTQDESLYKELTGTLTQVNGALQDISHGQGTVGQLLKNKDAYEETVKSLQEVRQMVSAVRQNADAIKALPVVRSYVHDPNRELIRPDCKRERKWFAEADLFEPGRAVLTDRGRRLLDEAAGWLNERKEVGSEVVVAAVADPRQNSEFAEALTRKQSEVVLDYLRDNHRVHRMGWWWWSNRPVKAVGCGNTPPPVPEAESLPPARVELLVFVPQK
jgi:phospholipid/cholesterol/gamma-HCH transport system substrate-binding protein